MAPDRRVSISNQVHFWTRANLISTYLHECAHRLLPGRGHDPAFAALLTALLLRSDAAGLTEDAASTSINLYCISDLPAELDDDADDGLGRCISWSVLTARELTVTELAAEDLAVEVVRRFDKWLAEVADEPSLHARAVRSESLARIAQERVVERLKDKLFISSFAACLSSVLLVLTIVMLVQR